MTSFPCQPPAGPRRVAEEAFERVGGGGGLAVWRFRARPSVSYARFSPEPMDSMDAMDTKDG